MGNFCNEAFILLNDNLGAASGFASETAGFDGFKTDHAVTSGVNGKVTAHICAVAGLFGRAGLTHQHFARADFLAAKAFDAQALAGVIVDVFTSSARFYM